MGGPGPVGMRYSSLKPRVIADQDAYRTWARNHATSLARRAQQREMEPRVEHYITTLMMQRRDRVRHLPKLYHQVASIPLHINDTIDDNDASSQYQLKHVESLATVGSALYVNATSLISQVLGSDSTPSSSTSSSSSSSSSSNDSKVSGEKISLKVWKRSEAVVSHDTKINELLSSVAHKVDIVISSAGLMAFIDNIGPDFTHEWELPVEVRMVTSSSSPPTKIVVIDKPLPKRYVPVCVALINRALHSSILID
jgi:hypothetical protein